MWLVFWIDRFLGCWVVGLFRVLRDLLACLFVYSLVVGLSGGRNAGLGWVVAWWCCCVVSFLGLLGFWVVRLLACFVSGMCCWLVSLFTAWLLVCGVVGMLG